MEKIKQFIGTWLPFAWWVLLALLILAALVCCIAQAAVGFGAFWAICGAVGTGLALPIFAWQAYGEFIEAREGDEE